MAEVIISHRTDLSKREQYELLLPQLKALIGNEKDVIANLSNLMAALKYGMNYFWVGCYLVKGDELILGPFQGTVACTRIKKGKGVCGTCWEKKETIIVKNVDEFPGHIQCSALSRSEIVVPFILNDEVFFVLDVDSDYLAAFDETDKFYLEQILDLMRESIEKSYTKIPAGSFDDRKKQKEISTEQDFKLLSEIGQQITASLTVEKVIETTYENINQLMDASSFWIGIYNPSTQRLDYPMGKEKGKTIGYAYYDLSDDKYLPVWSFKNQKMIFVNDYRKEYNNYIPNCSPPIPVAGDVPESSIWYPLISGEGKALGILTIQSFQINAYTKYHLNIVRNLAVFTTIALENALMYEQVEQKVKERTAEIAEKNKELEKLSIVASETGNAIFIADANGHLEWMNDACVRTYELALEDPKTIIGKPLIHVSSDPERLKKLMEESIRKKKSVVYESINTHRNGTKFWAQSTLTPIFDQQAELKKIVIIDTDITERKKQEEIIQQKNKSITDSINYAKRIQQAILPSTEIIYKTLPQSFIFYKPKDVVSGDFYFFTPKGEGYFIASVDCTGHGVPGAFMSMIGNDLLNQIIIEKNVTQPAEILNHLHRGVQHALKQGQQEIETRDGMDIALVSLEFGQNGAELQYAGANRPLYLIRENKLTEIKPNKFSIAGIQTEVERKFKNHIIQLSKGDTIYIFTDGYVDQFGGDKGKKFMTKRFQNLLLSIQTQTMAEQYKSVENALDNWKGDLEQVDDILVIGIRI